MLKQTMPCVLVIDDEAILCKRLKTALEKMGCNVETFVDGSEALKRIEERCFDIVVIDLKIGKVDGMQILEIIKQKKPNTEVIIITGFATAGVAKEALKKGASEFISKPFWLKDLYNAISRLTKKTQKRELLVI